MLAAYLTDPIDVCEGGPFSFKVSLQMSEESQDTSGSQLSPLEYLQAKSTTFARSLGFGAERLILCPSRWSCNVSISLKRQWPSIGRVFNDKRLSEMGQNKGDGGDGGDEA